MRATLAAAGFAAVTACANRPPDAPAPAARPADTAIVAQREHASEWGTRGYRLFVPPMTPAGAPLVVWLGSAQSAHVSGRVFEVEGGKVSVADGWQHGPEADKGARWDPNERGLLPSSSAEACGHSFA